MKCPEDVTLEWVAKQLEDVLDKWKKTNPFWPVHAQYFSSNSVRGLANFHISRFLNELYYNNKGTYDELVLATDLTRRLASVFHPDVSTEKSDMLAIWPDVAAVEAGENKRLRGKPGRMFRKMFPFVPDTYVEDFVDAFRGQYAFSEDDYTLKVSKDEADFIHAYTYDIAPTANIDHTPTRKSIANSCMRYGFDGLHTHPVAAYASGDFQIIWVEDKDGRIAARAVCSVENPVCSAIYGVNEVTIDMIQRHVEDRLYGKMWREYDYGDWSGCRLKAICEDEGREPDEDRGFIAPYLDMDPQRADFDGEYLVISGDGSVPLTDPDGVQYASGERCAECGHRHDIYDVRWVDAADGYVCEDCLNEHYHHCDYYDVYMLGSGLAVLAWNDYRNTEYDLTYSEEAVANGHAVETVNGELWDEDSVEETEDGDFVSKKMLNSGEYFISDHSGYPFPIDERVVCDGALIARSEVEEDYFTYNETTNEWERIHEEAA